MYKMHKFYGQICNFMLYYSIYVGPIFLKPFSHFKFVQFGRIANMWAQVDGFFHDNQTGKMIAFLLIYLLFLSHLAFPYTL